MSYAFKDLVDDGSREGHAVLEPAGGYSIERGETGAFLVEDIHQDGNVSLGPSASIIIRERDPREIVRNVFYPEKNLVKTVKSGNLLVRSQADYDTFFADAQKYVA